MYSPVVNLWIILGGDLGDVASVQKGPTHVTFLLNFFDELRRARRWVESRIPPGSRLLVANPTDLADFRLAAQFRCDH